MNNNFPEIALFCRQFVALFPEYRALALWEIIHHIPEIVRNKITGLGDEFIVENDVAIHQEAIIEEGVVLKGPAIICAGVYLAAHAYIRGGVFIGSGAVIGPGVEIKTSIVLPNARIAHFNFVGEAIIGSEVNMEAGSVIANHWNERQDKQIRLAWQGTRIPIPYQKFGAVVGDGSAIGANAVLSPGTLLPPSSSVARLELVNQDKG